MRIGGHGYRAAALYGLSTLLPSVVLAAAAEDIRGIRGPKTGAAPWAHPQMLAIAVIAVLGLAYLIRRLLQRVGRPPSLSASALQRLEDTRTLMSQQTAQAFGVSASDVIRDYIEKRFAVVATRQTTEEFLHALLGSSNEALTRHRGSLAEFLQQCDWVKFTGTSLQVSDMESLLQSARRFVMETDAPPLA